MIEAIKNVGKLTVLGALNRNSFLNGICKSVPSTKFNKKDKNNPVKQYIVILDFDSTKNKIKVDLEPVSVDSGNKYLFVGSTIRHKLYCSASSEYFERILTTTLPELKEIVSGNLQSNIEAIITKFFITYKIEDQKGSKKNDEIKCLIKPDSFIFFDKKVEEIKQQAKAILENLKDITNKADLNRKVKINNLWKDCVGEKYEIDSKKGIEEIKEKIAEDCKVVLKDAKELLTRKYSFDDSLLQNKKEFEKELKGKIKNLKDDIISSLGNDFKEENIAFLTLKIDGDFICITDEYKQMVYDENITKIFDNSDQYKDNYNQSGICSICANENAETTSNVTNLEYKFYITDKRGFSSNLDNKFTKNYNICKDCYQHLIIAENFISKKLKTKIGELSVYLIPQFVIRVSDFDIEDFSDCLKKTNNVLTNIESIKDFQKEWEKFIEYFKDGKNSFIINYLFYRPSTKGDFKILKLIKDVPPTRLDFIKKKEEEISLINSDHFGNDRRLNIDLNRIWNCIPVKIERNEKIGTAKYLEVVDTIFSDRIVDYGFLINQFIDVLRIIKFEREGYNVWSKDSNYKPDFNSKILQLNLLILFFKKLNILGGMAMEQNTSNIAYQERLPDEIKDYWKNLEIYRDERKRALFLLGYLIGEVGHKQSVKDIKNKPILNKVNFQGMGVEKLIRVLNEIPDKLRQYDILQYNEIIHTTCHLLMDNYIKKWELSNQENVFYTLSGYAFSNYAGWQRSKRGIEEKIRQAENDIQRAEEAGRDMSQQKTQLNEAKKLIAESEHNKANEILKQIKINVKEG
jgi:CRISPR-associated protein Csh1